jgi:hypothetical protein|tara:strand:+ start:587 stop:1270 length:684 start_codon:yes stop_codon:yes gene_type:complete
MKLTGREKKEEDDLDKLIELRKNYLAKKGKKPTPKNIKVDMRSTREKKEAAEYKKLEVLRKRYLTNVKKSKIPKVKKINSVKEIDTVIKEIKKPIISIAVVTVKPKNTEASISDAQKRSQTDKARSKSKSSLSDAQKRSQVRKSKSSISDAQKKTQTDIKRSKKQKGYYEDKKKGNAMVRVFPNDFVNGWANMTNAERKAKGYPTSDSKKYKVDYNQRKELTFIIKN